MAKLTVSINQFQKAVDGYRLAGRSEEDLELLQWFWGYGHSELEGDSQRMAEAIGYDTTTVYRICAGKYEGSLDNVLEAIGRKKRQTANRVAGIIRTPVVDRIWEALDYARDMGAMVVIRGETGRGKTFAAREWQRNNNHGRSIYIRCTTGTSKSMMLRLLADSLGIGSKSQNNSELTRRISHALTKRPRTLIVDEAGHLVPKGTRARSSTGALDTLRDFFDISGCGMVLILTNVYWSELAFGPMCEFFEQFIGRITFDVHIPEGKIFRDEVAAFCAAYSGDAPDPKLLAQARQIAESEGKLRALFTDLTNAAAFAKRRNVSLDAAVLRQAHAWRTAGGVWPEE
jgi:DNA transposition AAA+ family ATPase